MVDDDNARFLESSSAFQGALLLVAWPYIDLAIYLIIGNRKGLVKLVRQLAISLAITNPFLQTLWLVYTTWGSRISVGPPVIRFDVFATLLAASLLQNKGDYPFSGTTDMPPLIYVYITIASWATATARRQGTHSTRHPICDPRWIVCGVFVAGAAPAIIMQSLLDFRVAVPVVFQIILLLISWIPRDFSRGQAFCGTLFIIIAIGIQAWLAQAHNEADSESYFGEAFIAYPFFVATVDYPLWMLGWAFVIALWPLGRPIARGITWLAERFFGPRNMINSA